MITIYLEDGRTLQYADTDKITTISHLDGLSRVHFSYDYVRNAMVGDYIACSELSRGPKRVPDVAKVAAVSKLTEAR